MIDYNARLTTSMVGSTLSRNYGRPLNNDATTSTVNPVANKLWCAPFVIEYPTVAKRIIVRNGTAVAGNLDAGIWAASEDDANNGILLASSGSVAQSGTSATQVLDITDTMLGPGLYWVGLTMSDAATATVLALTVMEWQKAMGFKCKASATIPLASSMPTVTLETLSHAFIPWIGVEFATVLAAK